MLRSLLRGTRPELDYVGTMMKGADGQQTLAAAVGDMWRAGVSVKWSANTVPHIIKGTEGKLPLLIAQPQAAALVAVDKLGWAARPRAAATHLLSTRSCTSHLLQPLALRHTLADWTPELQTVLPLGCSAACSQGGPVRLGQDAVRHPHHRAREACTWCPLRAHLRPGCVPCAYCMQQPAALLLSPEQYLVQQLKQWARCSSSSMQLRQSQTLWPELRHLDAVHLC